MNGISKTCLYSIFSGMKQRCYNPNNQHYKWYGAKGITICCEWMGEDGLSRFMEWALSNGYEEHLTIDRIDASGPYSPSNCQWITRQQNSEKAEHKCTRQFIPQPAIGIRYKFDVMDALKTAGYSSTRLRNEKIMGESYMTQLRRGELVSWKTMETVCKLLNCQPGDILEYIDGGEAGES